MIHPWGFPFEIDHQEGEFCRCTPLDYLPIVTKELYLSIEDFKMLAGSRIRLYENFLYVGSYSPEISFWCEIGLCKTSYKYAEKFFKGYQEPIFGDIKSEYGGFYLIELDCLVAVPLLWLPEADIDFNS
jgi:hypothetical protein